MTTVYKAKSSTSDSVSPSPAHKPSALADFWRQLQAVTAQALARCSVSDCRLQVMDQQIRMLCTGEQLLSAFMPALAHLKIANTPQPAPDITFSLCDSAATGIRPPFPPFHPVNYHRYGQRAMDEDDRYAVMHSPSTDMIFAYDKVQRHGILWVADGTTLSIYECAAPVQTLFHWALRQDGRQIVHAAAVGQADGGVLLVGNTGAGKSTTALSVLQSDQLRYLSDDKCLVSLDPEPRAFGLFNSAKIKDDMLDHLPLLRPMLVGRDETIKVGKSLTFLYPHFQKQLICSFPIRALVIPRIAHLEKPHLTLTRPSDAFRVLGPSTVLWLPGAEADSYHFLAQLVKRLPCYFLDLAKNPADNLGCISALLKEST